MSKRAFVNLKVHSTYSILASTLSLDRIAALALASEQSSVCLADTNLHGALEFCSKCSKVGIQPLIALKLLVDDQQALFNSPIEPLPVTLVVQTEQGYANLLKLVNTSRRFSSHHVATLNQLEARSQGLALILGETGGLAWEIYKQFNSEGIASRFDTLREAFDNNVCFELQRGVFANRQFERVLTQYASLNKLLVVATNETHFESPADYEVYKMVCGASSYRSHVTNQNYFKSYTEMLTRYSDVLQALNNTALFCKTCNFLLEKRPTALPSFLSSNRAENKTLYLCSIRALEHVFYRIGKIGKRTYYKRLLREVGTVAKIGYSGYFLIVADFVLWSKANSIMVGPGRGSASGSLLAYCIGITGVDPIQHSLLFERFLNVNRASLPDIDIDFGHFGREKTMRYVQLRYGKEFVSQIVTLSSLQLRGALKEASRCLQLPFATTNLLCKTLPANTANQAGALKGLVQRANALIPEHEIEKLFAVTAQLIGVYKHVSTHAAGIIISNKPISEVVPTVWDKNGKMNVAQFSMGWTDASGLSKFDLLGLKTLTVVDNILEMLATTRVGFNIANCDDLKTFKLIREGSLLATFQLESKGISKHVKHMLPSSLNDLAALIALYRPGPIQNIRLYSDTKNKLTPRRLIHASIDSVLDETHGIIIYQEQVMLIAQKLSGYSLAEADSLRKAMTKKNKAEMLAHQQRFIAGAIKAGADNRLAANVFEVLTRFADYGFNKSHAVAYAVLAHTTAYLKANFTLEFYTVCLNAEIQESQEFAKLYYEALERDVDFAPPSVQTPCRAFKLNGGVIMFPLNAIKGIGLPIVDSIISSKAKTPFGSLADFCLRASSKLITKRVLKALVLAGALDCFELSRTQMLASLDEMSKCVKTKAMAPSLRPDGRQPDLATLREECLLLGCYVSENPLNRITCAPLPKGYELVIVVNQVGNALSLVTQTDKLDAFTTSTLAFELGEVYECKLDRTRFKIWCSHWRHVRS
ncbi:DNA polymerase III subunit alpha [Candidatus Hodgkinia cicadicola]